MANVIITLSVATGKAVQTSAAAIKFSSTTATMTIDRPSAEQLWLALGTALQGPQGGKKKGTGKHKIIRKR